MSRRNLINYLVLTIALGLFLELSAYGIIYVSRPIFSEPIRLTRDIYREQSEHINRWLEMGGRGRDVVDGQLGWRYRAGFSNARNQISAQGLRGAREYTEQPPAGVIRVAAFGDSFVYGNEVSDEHAWASVVDSSFADIEMLNYGVGGYGLDQALLRFQAEGSDLSPHVVLIGFIADDIRRVVNVYQRFASTSSGVFTKPRFELGPGGELTLQPSPIQRLEDWRQYLDDPAAVTAWGQNDQWYEPLIYENPLYDLSAAVRLFSTVWVRIENRYLDSGRLFRGEDLNTNATAYRLQMAVFEQFAEDVREAGHRPIVLFLPSRGELQSALSGRRVVYEPLAAELRSRGIENWDATDAFSSVSTAEPPIGSWFAPGGHYSPAGNRIVAAWLGPRLRETKRNLLGDAGP